MDDPRFDMGTWYYVMLQNDADDGSNTVINIRIMQTQVIDRLPNNLA